MILALARRGDAPRSSPRSTAWVPARALVTGTLFGYIAVIMSYVSPDRCSPSW